MIHVVIALKVVAIATRKIVVTKMTARKKRNVAVTLKIRKAVVNNFSY